MCINGAKTILGLSLLNEQVRFVRNADKTRVFFSAICLKTIRTLCLCRQKKLAGCYQIETVLISAQVSVIDCRWIADYFAGLFLWQTYAHV